MIKIIMTKHLALVKFSLNKDLEGEFNVISFLTTLCISEHNLNVQFNYLGDETSKLFIHTTHS